MDAIFKKITDEFTKQGKIIEVGWVGYQMMCMPKNASETQFHETRQAFFAGAQHLFASIMATLDQDENEFAEDEHKLTMIDKELREFRDHMELRYTRSRGQA